MNRYQPPLTITPTILALASDIGELLGRLSARQDAQLTPQLRRGNRIRTIQASLAIENNTLSVDQVTAVLEGKLVLGLPQEIQEVRNAFEAYEGLASWRPESRADLLSAHARLMHGLIDDAGNFRRGGVGIYRGDRLLHMAPPANRVGELTDDLLGWLVETNLPPLIASCVFHYEFEFIHPFADGNGRMGRLWQTLILSRWRPVLAYLPVEAVIREQQDAYYAALSAADQSAEATPFVAFMLQALRQALDEAVGASLADLSEKASEKTPEKIVLAITNRPTVTIADLAKQIGVSPRTIERNLSKLQQLGRLRRVGPDKGGHWEMQE